MRFDWDEEKNAECFEKRGLSFEQVIGIFRSRHHMGIKSDDPLQFLAIGFVGIRLIVLIFEEREDDLGEFIYIVTYWDASRYERRLYEESQT